MSQVPSQKWLWIFPLGGFLLGFIYLWLVLLFRQASTLKKRMLEERLTHLGISHETILNLAPRELLRKNGVYQLLNPKRLYFH